MQRKIDIINQWIDYLGEKQLSLGANKICPFAFKNPPVVQVDKLSESNFVNLTSKLTIFIETELNSSYEELEKLCFTLKSKYPQHVFLPDHPHKKNYINGNETGNGHFPCIIVQTHQELNNARELLSKTDYYNYWSQDYLDEIKKFG